MYPIKRNRRLRANQYIRNLVKENNISANDLIYPLFIIDGKGIKEEIPSMRDYYTISLDILKKEVKLLWKIGIQAVLIFPKIKESLKDNKGSEAINKDGLVQRAIMTIKESVPSMIVITDIALDPYSSYGHDGIVKNGEILNDETVEILQKMALSHAISGADIVAPSDMMDGRIKKIRLTLESENYHNTSIMSYSAKFASNYYGPFRDALGSKPNFGDKKSYQIDFHNSKQAIDQALRDIDEGADIIMIKPGIAYLDIVKELSMKVNTPIASYQVSGEYSMIKESALKGIIEYEQTIYEQLIAFKRAGCKLIVTYFAKEFLQKIKI